MKKKILLIAAIVIAILAALLLLVPSHRAIDEPDCVYYLPPELNE